jgi:hypothetical protein
MKPIALLKQATIASSVLLVAGFVCYRAGAFSWLSDPRARSVDSGTDSTREKNVAADPNSDSGTVPQAYVQPTEGDRTLIGSSKSLVISPGPFPVTSGSKDPKVEPPLPAPAEAQRPAPPEPPPPKATERDRTLLPGPKSAPVANPRPKP